MRAANNTVTYELRKGLFGVKRKLVFAPDHIAYENRDRLDDLFTKINAADITDVKHHVEWIVWYRFHVGRVYEIVIRHKDQAELRITFSSLFGFRDHYMDVYGNMMETFWAMYFQKVVDGLRATFEKNGTLTVSGVQLLGDGVWFPAQGELVPWEKIGYAEYYSYFALYHADRAKTNVRRDFYAWESEILLSLIRTIKAERTKDI